LIYLSIYLDYLFIFILFIFFSFRVYLKLDLQNQQDILNCSIGGNLIGSLDKGEQT